jgi:NADPH:quinone reductase-like Zn-dependent oxidoreductase
VKAAVLREFGGPDVLRLEDVPAPVPAPGEVLVRVGAVSINRSFDLMVRSGADPRGARPPLILGADPSGEVVALGVGVTTLRVGDHVAATSTTRCGFCPSCRAGRPAGCNDTKVLGIHGQGGYAEFVAVPATSLRVMPPDLPFPEATVIYRHAPAAVAQLSQHAQLQPDEWVLVMGAAGALGSFVVQIARIMGARVIAAAGTDERVAWAVQLGAHYGVNYRASALTEEVMRITENSGVNVVCENIGDPTLWPGAFNSLARDGRLVTMGAHGGGIVSLDVRRLYGMGLRVIGGTRTRPADVDRAMELAPRLTAGIDSILPLRQAAEAHRRVESGEALGKVILDPTME